MKPSTLRRLWAAVLLAGLLPALRLIYSGGRWLLGDLGALGANPVETATHTTGAWALYLLLATLLITPLRRLLGLGWLLRFRRLLGLLSFAYTPACIFDLVAPSACSPDQRRFLDGRQPIR